MLYHSAYMFRQLEKPSTLTLSSNKICKRWKICTHNHNFATKLLLFCVIPQFHTEFIYGLQN